MTELKTQHPKQAKNNVRIAGRVGHELSWLQFGLVLE